MLVSAISEIYHTLAKFAEELDSKILLCPPFQSHTHTHTHTTKKTKKKAE
jgi:hypothetical protein